MWLYVPVAPSFETVGAWSRFGSLVIPWSTVQNVGSIVWWR
jgi:hypothetical protein